MQRRILSCLNHIGVMCLIPVSIKPVAGAQFLQLPLLLQSGSLVRTGAGPTTSRAAKQQVVSCRIHTSSSNVRVITKIPVCVELPAGKQRLTLQTQLIFRFSGGG